MTTTVTDVSYAPKTAKAHCDHDCGWFSDGDDSPVRRLARQHSRETGHTTIVRTEQRVTYTRISF